MIEDVFQLRDRAKSAASRGQLDEAAALLLTAAQQTHIAEGDYGALLLELADVTTKRGDVRSALSVYWYFGAANAKAQRAIERLLPDVPPVNRGRTYALRGDMARAAKEMEDAGLPAAAAIHKEKAEDYAGARALWSRLAQVTAGGADAYNAALVQFNLGRCAKKCDDARQAREALVAAVRLLEEAADHFESVGQRERAFDCFQVLVQIGRESGMFEDVLEGFVNCIPILREDHLKYFALQYFEDALSAAREKKEHSAAAALAREASDYARAIGMTAVSGHYTQVQAELWVEAARAHTARGAPPEIAENAYLAAVLALGETGRFPRVGELYAELSRMDLEPPRKAHYARAAKRYAGVGDEGIESAPLPAHLRQDNHFPDVWHVDLLEWEQQGSASEACADLVLDLRWPDLTRRRALLARLSAFTVEQPRAVNDKRPATSEARAKLAGELASLQLYAVLSPLERLFAKGDRVVKVGVLTAMQTLCFKRSFITVREGLRDPDPGVVGQAAKAVESLYFAHAFDPLSRIVREFSEAPIRGAALRALARVDTIEAAEFLLGVLEHGAPANRQAALEGLRRSRGSRFVEIARAALPEASPPVQNAIRELLRARGFAS